MLTENEVLASVAPICSAISQNLRDGLLNGNLDMVFLSGAIIESNVRNVDYVCYPMAWVASPELPLAAEAVSLAEIAQFPILTYSRRTRPNLDIRDKFVRASIANYKIYGNTSLSAVVKLCVDAVGVAVIPPAVIRHELDSKKLRLVDVSGGALTDLHFTISYMLTADAHLLEAVAALALQS